jgi:HTH-type transcriptional regulator/antitoxin HigA
MTNIFSGAVVSLKKIKSNHQYKLVLNEIESLMDAQKDTAEGFKLDQLVSIVENFERKRVKPLFGVGFK